MKKPTNKMGSVDFCLYAIIMILVAIGSIMVYSASSYSAFFDPKIHDSMFYLKKQLEWAVLGSIIMYFTLRVDYHFYKKYTGLIMILTVILLSIVFAFPPNHGARRWIYMGSFSMQPSEIAKYTIVLFMAKSLESKSEKVRSLLYGVLPYILVSGFYAAMVLAEKNLSIAAVIMIVTIILLFAAGAKISHLIGLVGIVGAIGAVAIKYESFRLKRVLVFLDPWKDPKKDGYQIIQSWLALGSGGILGMGLGKSRQKCYYIPEPHNDFIFSIIGEELGLVGCIFIIMLFLLLIWRGIRIAIHAKDTYGSLLAIGITAVIAVQAIINIAVVTGSMPVTGVPLPFISYGGSSLVINLFAMGVLLNISRQIEIKK